MEELLNEGRICAQIGKLHNMCIKPHISLKRVGLNLLSIILIFGLTTVIVKHTYDRSIGVFFRTVQNEDKYEKLSYGNAALFVLIYGITRQCFHGLGRTTYRLVGDVDNLVSNLIKNRKNKLN